MEKIISKIAALGIPGLVLTVLFHFAGGGLSGFLIAMSTLSFGGFWGGFVTLGVIGLISQGLTEFGFDAIFTGVVKELYRRGETKVSIMSKIEGYPVSKSLKRKLKEELEKM